MSNINLRNLTNDFMSVRLVSLASWQSAKEIVPRDHAGPYVILQEGYDPQDFSMRADEFVLGRSGKWLSLSYFYKMPIPERRAEFVFGTAAEVMKMMADLPPSPQIIRPGSPAEQASATSADEMAEAIQAGRKPPPGAGG